MGLVGNGALAPLLHPLASQVGFNNLADPMFITAKGELVYRERTATGEDAFYRFRTDTGVTGPNGWTYPVAPKQNDIPIPLVGGCTLFGYFPVWPDTGDLVFTCGDSSTDSGFSDSRGLFGAGPGIFKLFGFGRMILKLKSNLGPFVVRNAEGLDIDVSGLVINPLAVRYVPMKATAAGFLVVETVGCTLHLIEYDGSVKLLGTYAPLPTRAKAMNGDDCAGAALQYRVLDAEGNLYVWVALDGTTGNYGVAMRPLLPQTSTVVYDEATLPPRDNETDPPVLPVRITAPTLLSP